MDLRGVLAAALIWGCCVGDGRADRWWTYERCRLMAHPANDGDSFHVQTKSDHYLYRLYFVDAPETDDLVPERVKEQMEYWDVTQEELFQAAAEATAFTKQFLRIQFTVYSKREDARGRSKLPRFYAAVETEDKDLALALVENGLARAYGCVPSDMPDDGNPRKTAARLRAAEREAKRAGRGIWRFSGTSLTEQYAAETVKEQDLVLTVRTAVYAAAGYPRLIGFLPAGAGIRVTGADGRKYVKVRFEVDGKPFDGRCRRSGLDLR